MRLGLFGARCDRRGLAVLAENIYHGLQPERTLVLDMGRHRPFPSDPSRYSPWCDVITLDKLMVTTDWGWWLDSVDTLLTLETPYNFGIFDAARKYGVRTVLLVMPEYNPYGRGADLPRPDLIAYPTWWLTKPGDAVLPVPMVRFEPAAGDAVLHPAGSPAHADRNGTRVVIDASPHAPELRWLIRGQSWPAHPHRNTTIEIADLPDPEPLYDGAQMVVLPRRYGGLSLPAQEAIGAGLPLLVGAHDPYASYIHPAGRIDVVQGQVLAASGGNIRTWDPQPEALAAAVRSVANDEGLRGEMAEQSREIARGATWGVLRPLWEQVLAG